MTKLSDIVKRKKESKSNFFFGKIASLCEEYWNKALGKEYNVIIKNSEDIKQEIDFGSLKFPKSFIIENAKEIAEYIVIPKQEKFPSEIKISNLAELSKYFEIKQKIEIPKSFDIKNLKDIPSIKFPENLKKLSFKKTEEILSKLVKEFALARKAKRDEVFIKNKDPKEYIPVRIVDKRGTDFIESFGSAILALPDEVGQLNASKIRINPATEEKQDTIIGNQTDGDQKTQLIDSSKINYSVQNPLPSDGDSVYEKDLDISNITKVGWTGTVEDLFGCPHDSAGIYNDTTTNPKILYIPFCRTVYLNAIGLGCNISGKTFSNVKIEFIGSDGTVRSTYDNSSNNTKYGTRLYSFAPTACVGIKLYFATANTDVGLTNITIQKETAVRSRLQGLKPDGTVTDFSATTAGNFKCSIEELENDVSVNSNTQLKITPYSPSGLDMGGRIFDILTGEYKGLQFNAESPQICSQDYLLAMSEGDITGHTSFAKFGRVIGVNNLLVDIWDGEGGTASQYVFPPSAIQFNVVSTSANDDLGNTGIEKIMIVGLDANYAEQTEEVTMNGTAAVTTTKSFLRINSCYATQAGSAGVAIGKITIKNTTNTITYSAINIGLTACRTLVYTVPAGKTLYLTSITVASGAGGNALKLNAVTFTPKYRVFGSTVFIPAGEFLSLNNEIARPLEVPGKFTEKTDIKMSVQGDYDSGGTVCIGAVRGWLESNN